jgi:diadenosine tetraphosphate (Ap4A) HIT family hydrolase
MPVEGCAICEIVSTPEEYGRREIVVVQGISWLGVMSYKQRYLGRTVFFLKKHREDLGSLSEREMLELGVIIKKYEDRAREAWGVTMFNWACLMNDSPHLRHVHFHCYPRYNHPVEVLGETYRDPNFGHPVLHGKEPRVSRRMRWELARQVGARREFNPGLGMI